MKRFAVLFVSVSCSFISWAQCPVSDLVFISQAEVDAFPTDYPGCAVVPVNITIVSPANVTDLSPLAQITSIDGNLIIDGSGGLTSLSGLDNVTTITGSLGLLNNPALTSLTGLEGLTSIGGILDINNNPLLTDLIPLSNLAGIGDQLIIIANTQLTDLSGLENLTSVPSYLNISSNASLINFTGLEGVTSIGIDLDISNNAQLVDLTGLNNLTTIDRNMVISDNPSLTSLSGLEGLTSLGGDLTIAIHPQLTTMAALNNLGSIDGQIQISDNPLLVSLDGLGSIAFTTITDLTIVNNPNLILCSVPSICDYLAVPGASALIIANENGCNSPGEVINICNNELPVELTDFTATTEGQDVVLHWKTVSEKNNTGFRVQHTQDMETWTDIAFVPGKGTTTELTTYRYPDQNAPVEQLLYYRLQQIDVDGTTEYSPVVSAFVSAGKDIVLYPNPTTGKVRITGTHSETVVVTDSQGRIITLNPSSKEEALDLSGLPAGTYFVQVTEKGLISRCRIVKE